MAQAKLSSKYQVVIPTSVRRRMGLKAGTRVTIQPIDERHALVTTHPRDAVRALKGLGKDLWKKLGGGQAYIRHERASWQK